MRIFLRFILRIGFHIIELILERRARSLKRFTEDFCDLERKDLSLLSLDIVKYLELLQHKDDYIYTCNHKNHQNATEQIKKKERKKKHG